MTTINFETVLFKIGSWTILRLPKDASAKLPSRGLAMVKGTINGVAFESALEPDGNWNHWFKVDKNLRQATGAEAGDTVKLAIQSTKDWPEPTLPPDISAALASNPEANATWKKATPLAHWEWVRWIRSTSRDETRTRRIEVACSKLKAGERRPCCFNSNMCTEPSVSKNGVLLEPAQTANT